MDSAKIGLLYEAAKVAYNQVLRDLVADKVASTDNQIDDYFLKLFDMIFQYKK